MKIEKVNENQIRCTLTARDMRERDLRISELAYGSPKARSLFRDLMQQALDEVGFDPGDTPLMIEAIPLAQNCIVLIVTKVEDPEELDTRFSNFAPSLQPQAGDSQGQLSDFEALLRAVSQSAGTIGSEGQSADTEDTADSADAEDADAPLTKSGDAAEDAGSGADFAKESAATGGNSRKSRGNGKAGNSRTGEGKTGDQKDAGSASRIDAMRRYAMLHRVYTFASMEDAITAASVVFRPFRGASALYSGTTETGESAYYLTLTFPDADAANKAAGIIAGLSEYAEPGIMTQARQHYLSEHCRALIPQEALELLAAAAYRKKPSRGRRGRKAD